MLYALHAGYRFVLGKFETIFSDFKGLYRELHYQY